MTKDEFRTRFNEVLWAISNKEPVFIEGKEGPLKFLHDSLCFYVVDGTCTVFRNCPCKTCSKNLLKYRVGLIVNEEDLWE